MSIDYGESELDSNEGQIKGFSWSGAYICGTMTLVTALEMGSYILGTEPSSVHLVNARSLIDQAALPLVLLLSAAGTYFGGKVYRGKTQQ